MPEVIGIIGVLVFFCIAVFIGTTYSESKKEDQVLQQKPRTIKGGEFLWKQVFCFSEDAELLEQCRNGFRWNQIVFYTFRHCGNQYKQYFFNKLKNATNIQREVADVFIKQLEEYSRKY